MTRIRIGSIAAIAVLAAIQLVPVERHNPSARGEPPAPDAVLLVLRESCFDCHSHETRWPWYAFVAPFSWRASQDVSEGRAELNFSLWDDYDLEERLDRIEEVQVEIDEGNMPLFEYRLLHPGANLDAAELGRIAGWIHEYTEALREELE